MGGIMVPITMGRGFREARQDNRRDDMLEMEKQNSELRRKGLDLQLQEGQMRMDDAKANQPLVKMQRDAAMVSHIATFGLSNLGDVDDADLPEYAAKLLSDMPMGGQVRVQEGQLISNGKPVPVTREWLEDRLTKLAVPEMALKMKMAEHTPAKFADAQGNVSTMTPAEAKTKGGFTQVEDMTASLGLKKGLVEDKYAERKEQGALNLQTAQINSANRANQREPKEPKAAQYVDPKTGQVVTMPVEEGQRLGLQLYGDVAATNKLKKGEDGEGGEGGVFSKTTPQASWDAGKKQAMTLLGYVAADTNVWGEPIAWAQIGPGGEKLSGPVDHSAANKITNDAYDLVANKKPVVFPDGSTRVISTVTEAVQILADAHLRKKARYAKETADAKKAATEAMNATNR